jgi:hypothetical protein
MGVNLNAVVLCKGEPLECVSQFKYLGLIIDAQSTSPVCMLQQRVLKAKQAFNLVRVHARLLGLKNGRVRVQLVNALATSTLLFGSVLFSCLGPATM